MPTGTIAEQLFEPLRAAAKYFGPELARTAYQRGLAVTDKTDGSTKPIPITGTAMVLPTAELKRRQDLSRRLSSAGVKMARYMAVGDHQQLALGGLSPLERQLADQTAGKLDTLITTRVDFFVGAGGAKALELNATIPAMQGYSDIAANALIEVAGRYWGAPDHLIAGWQAKNGSNTMALYRAILDGYSKVRPGRSPDRLALLVRRNDAQLTEQNYLCERFREFGQDCDVVYPDQLSGDDAVKANGKTYDMIYRHLFVRRLEEPDMKGADYVRALLAEPNGKRVVVLNPPASQVEVKAVFALLSQALEDRALVNGAGLNDEELAAIKESVPWTRPFQGEELVKKVAGEPDRYVLKRSWDYGGRAVFVGKSRKNSSFVDRTKTAYGTPLDWEQLCARAAADTAGGGFVVQELVATEPEDHVLCSGNSTEVVGLYVDFSAYASVGLSKQPSWGGVCRGSLSQIVNIVGGGGVLPLLTEEVAQSLLNAYRANKS